MDQAATLFLAAMRWMHFLSIAALIGGIIYYRAVLTPISGAFSPEVRSALEKQASARFRPIVFAAIGSLLVSGMFNLYSKPGSSSLYHALLGVKFLLVLHIFAVAFLIVKPDNPKRARMMTGAAISGVIVILISTYLGRIA
jgi:putative copper export protein